MKKPVPQRIPRPQVTPSNPNKIQPAPIKAPPQPKPLK